jgi:hypothetical protein
MQIGGGYPAESVSGPIVGDPICQTPALADQRLFPFPSSKLSDQVWALQSTAEASRVQNQSRMLRLRKNLTGTACELRVGVVWVICIA